MIANGLRLHDRISISLPLSRAEGYEMLEKNLLRLERLCHNTSFVISRTSEKSYTIIKLII